ncbi:hypothetical protein V6Z11_A09G223200 [Gossypium hirsutum]
MEGSSSSSRHVLAILLIILQFTPSIAKTFSHKPYHTKRNTEYIRSSCTTTTYPRLCYRSLSIYASKINTSPRLIAHTALLVTFRASKSTSRFMRKIARTHRLKPRVAAAMADCIEVIDDSIDELQKSIDEDTCMDGFSGRAMNGYAKMMVRKRIVKIAHLTSNALALINNYASSQILD